MKKGKRTIFKRFMKKKLVITFFTLFLLFNVLIIRLIALNMEKGEQYKKKVLSQQTYVSTVIPYKRGNIVDRKGTVLAQSEKVYNLIIDPKQILTKVIKNEVEEEVYRQPTVEAINTCFQIEKDEIEKVLIDKPNSQYVVMKKTLSYEEIEPFLELSKSENSKIKGVWFEEDYIRTYPNGSLACDLIGFTSKGNVGEWGIEKFYNESLNGSTGQEYGYYDSTLNLERVVKPAVNGNTIYSTIDANIQSITEKYIKEFNDETGSKNTGVIIMNPNNGEILAMASYPVFDLNTPRDLSNFFSESDLESKTEEDKLDFLNSLWRNYCISDTYEPGSTYKPFTIATGFEEDKLHGDETYVCDGKEVVVAGQKPIKCNNRAGHGLITLEESLMYSCNDALMSIGKLLGKEMFLQYQTNFGFGQKTGIDLPGETSASSLMYTIKTMGPVELATESFGQAFNVTMIQLISSFCSIINGGYYYEPHIVKQIINDNGGVVKNVEAKLLKETVSKETSQILNKYLLSTVESGTAQPAKVSGYDIGGKTGTAEKLPRGNGKYVVSFIGAAPMDNPELAIYVVIDEPNVEKQADSKFSSRLAQKILNEVLPYRNIFPKEDVIPTSTKESDPTGTTNPETGENTTSTQEQTTAPNTGETQSTTEVTEEITSELDNVTNEAGETVTNSENPKQEYSNEEIID